MSALLSATRWIYLALAAAAAFGLWLMLHDRAVVRDHERKVAAAVASATNAANEAALRNDATRAARDAAQSAVLREDIVNAEKSHPDDARRPSGPVVNAVADRLRQRQAGGATR